VSDGEDNRVDLVVAQRSCLFGRFQFRGKGKIGSRPTHLLHHDFEGRTGAGAGIAEIDALALEIFKGVDARIRPRNNGKRFRVD